MASLPHHFPHLSLHLADRSLTPLISSSTPSSSSSPTSPLRHAALARLASSALGVHDAASRLGLGAPQRVLVEYGPRGPVLIQTFLDPATASAVAPTGGSGRPRRPGAAGSALSSSSTTATTTVGAAAASTGGGGDGPSAGAPDARRGPTTAARRAEGEGGGTGMARQAAVNGTPRDDRDLDDDECGHDETEAEAEAEAETGTSSPDVPPMLLGVILAANPDESSSARRATVRIERIGRQIQESWAAEGDQPLL